MVKNNTSKILSFLPGLLFWLSPLAFFAQEPKIFTVKDFDLKGKVKSCLVITNYGKEEFEFNEAGVLTKAITRFNENDYDITHYKYSGDILRERRMESYRDGTFNKSMSIAHFYSIDTAGNKKITEKIIDYNQNFLDQYEYQYNAEAQLSKIMRSNNDGLDETTIERSYYKGETTTSYMLNGVIQKSVRESVKKKGDGSLQKIVLTKEYLNGAPTKALEAVFDENEVLLSEEQFEYNITEQTFVPASKISYTYDDHGFLIKAISRVSDLVEEREYVYQFDAEENGNWVKLVITPHNEFTTRKITYYPDSEVTLD